jgi:hypothetical protein
MMKLSQCPLVSMATSEVSWVEEWVSVHYDMQECEFLHFTACMGTQVDEAAKL